MRLDTHAVLFTMGGIPVIGNVLTGSIVGLTPHGAELCSAMTKHDVASQDIPADCIQLVEYLQHNSFLESNDASFAPSPQSAYFHVTNSCNLQCVACYSMDMNRNRAQDPSFHDIQHALNMLAQLGVKQLVVSGGEPFLRGDLPDIAEYATDHGIEKVVILTNGTLCSDAILNKLKHAVHTISVSFDGTSQRSLADVRNEQLYSKLVESVHRIQAAGIHAHILPTLHAKNIDDYSKYLKLADNLHASISFSLLSGKRDELGNLFLTEPDLAHLANIAHSSRSLLRDGAHGAIQCGTSLQARAGCGAGVTEVSVAADGAVYPCHMLHNPKFKLGNAFSDSVERIAVSLSEFSLPTVDEIAACRDCDLRYLCGGGCRARGWMPSENAFARDSYCSFYCHSLTHAIDSFLAR